MEKLYVLLVAVATKRVHPFDSQKFTSKSVLLYKNHNSNKCFPLKSFTLNAINSLRKKIPLKYSHHVS